MKYNVGKLKLSIQESWPKVLTVFTISAIVTLFIAVYILGMFQGFVAGQKDINDKYQALFNEELKKAANAPTSTPTSAPSPTAIATPRQRVADWGGPELWEQINKRRVELGVNPLNQRDELCTIAAIRLNQLLEVGSLDNHEGFGKLKDEREDLKWIFEKYSTMAEFLAVGGDTAEETVSLWENTLGHKKLLTGGEYVWGCVYAQNTFAVAITAF